MALDPVPLKNVALGLSSPFTKNSWVDYSTWFNTIPWIRVLGNPLVGRRPSVGMLGLSAPRTSPLAVSATTITCQNRLSPSNIVANWTGGSGPWLAGNVLRESLPTTGRGRGRSSRLSLPPSTPCKRRPVGCPQSSGYWLPPNQDYHQCNEANHPSTDRRFFPLCPLPARALTLSSSWRRRRRVRARFFMRTVRSAPVPLYPLNYSSSSIFEGLTTPPAQMKGQAAAGSNDARWEVTHTMFDTYSAATKW